jgi:hypothetical protein
VIRQTVGGVFPAILSKIKDDLANCWRCSYKGGRIYIIYSEEGSNAPNLHVLPCTQRRIYRWVGGVQAPPTSRTGYEIPRTEKYKKPIKKYWIEENWFLFGSHFSSTERTEVNSVPYLGKLNLPNSTECVQQPMKNWKCCPNNTHERNPTSTLHSTPQVLVSVPRPRLLLVQPPIPYASSHLALAQLPIRHPRRVTGDDLEG